MALHSATCPEGPGPGHLSALAPSVQGSPPPSSGHCRLLSPPLPSSFSQSHLRQPLPWLLLTSVLLDCPSSYCAYTHLFPLSGLSKAGRGWVPPGLWAPQAETSGPLPRCQPSGNPSPQLGGRGDSTQRVKALGGRGWARSWAAPLKEGAGAGNSHPTSPPPSRALPHPSQPAPPRGQEELPARPLSVQVSRPCSGLGDQAPGAAWRPRIGQGSERDWKQARKRVSKLPREGGGS